MPHSEAALPLHAAPPDLALIRYAVGSTLLPHHVAELITNLSLVARVSLRATAFFLEIILEATKMGTGMGLGLTRRALISAIGATRTMQALTGADGGSGYLLTAEEAVKGPNNAIFAMLDKYTAVGIYVVHHSLTMTELFAMSGISLVQDSLRAGFTAAEASVQVLDGVFGSNETSRALSSFIDLVRKELFTKDGNTSSAAGVKIMAGITRAITTFAIVQAATHRRTARSHKMKVLYDCTVLGEVQTSAWEGILKGPTPGTFRHREGVADELQQPQIEAAGISRAPSTSTLIPRSPSVLESELDRSRSFYASRGRKTPRPTSTDTQEVPQTPSIAAGLDFFCGDDDDDGDDDRESPQGEGQRANVPRTVSVSRLQSDEELRPTVKAKLNQYSEEDLRRGVVVDRQRVDTDNGRELRQVVRRADDIADPSSSRKTVWEVITETTEITETIEEHEEREEVDEAFSRNPFRQTSPHPSPPRAGNTRRSGFASRIRPRMSLGSLFSGTKSQLRQDPTGSTIIETDRDVTQRTHALESGRSLPDGGYEQVMEDEQEWEGISRTLSNAHFFDDERGSAATAIEQQIPSVGNGLPQESPRLVSASSSTDEAKESTRRMRVVLKRVRKKLIKTTRVVTTRGVAVESTSEEAATEDPSQADLLADDQPNEDSDPVKGGIRRAMSKAKSTLTPVKAKPSSPSMLKVPERHGSLFKAAAGDAGEMPTSPTKKRHSRVLSQASIRSYTSRQHTSAANTTAHGAEPADRPIYPQGSLADNLHRFMRYASACYGHNFMNILGIGDPYQFRSTKQTHANVWAFAHHIGIPFEDVLLSSYSQETDEPFHSRQMAPVVNFVAIDRAKKAVVLACRGTLGLSDILVDLTCEYSHVELAIGQGHVHSGIFNSAASLAASHGTVKSTIVRALEDNPDYGLITVGHSLGGGVAACLALLWSCPAEAASKTGSETTTSTVTPFVTSVDSGLPAGRPIHSYAYGPPAITDAELATAATGLITSVVHNHDVVPSLSLGTIRDFKQIAEVLEDAAGESCTEILGRTIGMYQRKGSHAGGSEASAVETKAIYPTEAAEEERCLTVDRTELTKGKTRNRATDAGYVDPNHRAHGTKPRKRASHSTGGRSKGDDLEDWLWSLIKTMRAHAQSDKLYPPGVVLCLESFDVYVRRDGGEGEGEGESSSGTKTTTAMSAHRVILRRCDDVRTRFAEPVFCRTLFRDHSPAGYEFCLDLLKKAQE